MDFFERRRDVYCYYRAELPNLLLFLWRHNSAFLLQGLNKPKLSMDIDNLELIWFAYNDAHLEK